MQTLKLADDLFESMYRGIKRCTIRKGKRDVVPGNLLFESISGDQAAGVIVSEVRVKKLGELTDEEAQADGAANAAEMAEALKRFYPDINSESDITIVFFSMAGD